MNVFATHGNPVASAAVLDDLRVNKMLVETAQILCTAAHICFADCSGLYKSTHATHPCVLWAATTHGAATWLLEHAQALEAERQLAKPKQVHRSLRYAVLAHLRLERVGAPCATLPSGVVMRFADCSGIPEEFSSSVHERYRECMRRKWRAAQTAGRPPRWGGDRAAPSWALDAVYVGL